MSAEKPSVDLSPTAIVERVLAAKPIPQRRGWYCKAPEGFIYTEETVLLAHEVLRLRGVLKKIGHREEPATCDTKDKMIGYLIACEDVIRDAEAALAATEGKTCTAAP